MPSIFNLVLEIVNMSSEDLKSKSGIQDFLKLDQFKLDLCNWLSKQRKSFLTVDEAIKEFKRND